MKNYLTTLACALFAAGTLNAQTYDYDSANESLTITGKGNSVQDRITLEGPITPGSTVPGTSQVFGDTKTITLKDVWTSPDSTRIKYTEPTSAGNNTTLKLENSRLGASGDFDKGGTGLTLIMDSKSTLNLYGNRLTNTTRIENEGYISTTNGTVSESSYLWDNKTSTGSSGVLGGSGVYNFGNVSSIATDKDFGLIRSQEKITDLEISGDYRVDGNSANTTTNDSFIVGVNSSVSTEGQEMTISGKLTVEAKQGNGIGILVNQLGSDDVSLENNYSGEITVKAKNAFGIKVGGNAAKDASVAGDIYQLSVGTLNVENTITSGSEQSEATGIYAKSVKRGLSADSFTVKGYTDATGIQLTEGGSNISVNDMKVSAGQNGNAAGIIAAPDKTTAVSAIGDFENITVGNMEVSAGADAIGILANSVKKSGGNENVIGNITVSSTNRTAGGIIADNADITLGGKISASSENGDAYAIRTGNDLNLKMRDGTEISATTADENAAAFAIRSEIGDIRLEFEGGATITGDISAKNITLANGAAATINGNIEGETLSSGAVLDKVSGSIKFNQAEDITIKTSVGSMDIGTLTGDANIAKNTDSVKIGSVKNITLSDVAGGTSEIGNVENNLTANINGGKLEVTKVANNAEITGSRGEFGVGEAKTVNVTSNEIGRISTSGTQITTNGDLKISVGKAENVNFTKIKGGSIFGLDYITKITIGFSEDELGLGLNSYLSAGVTVKNASALVKIGKVGDIDITLTNDADLIAAADSTVFGTAKVNGGCDATFQNVANLRVGQDDGAGGFSGLNGNLNVNGTVNDALVKNVSEQVYLNAVANSAVIEDSGSAIVENSAGGITLRRLNSATVNNSTATIAAENISGGLSVGNVADINVSNTDINVQNGKTVNGNITSTTDLTLTNGGSATVVGSISAVGKKLTINSAFNVISSAPTAINAGTLSGSGLAATIHNIYDNTFGFSDTSDANGNLTAISTLKGTHNVTTNNIVGQIEGELESIENAHTTVKFVNVGNNVGYTIEKNSYISDTFANGENEKGLASIYDDLEYVEGDDAANLAAIQKKRQFVALASTIGIGAILPQSVVHSVRMNMDLGDTIHLDTLNRTSATRDMLQAYADSGNAEDAWNSTVSVRNINRFATYGGDENIDGSNDYIYGGLANVEYAANKNFFAGIGIGGFQAKSSGKGNCGKAETQSIAANVYADWRFFDNFDWYIGATYAFGMNKAERVNVSDTSKAEWDSNLAGVFTGIRYSIKPFADTEFYIKPTIGANANFLMNPSFDEKSGAERLSVESDNYTSVKSLAGLEATYVLPYGFSISGRMFYTHEFCDNRYDIGATMSTGSQFRVRGWKMDRDAGIFGAGIGYDITSKWRIYADYAAEVSGEVYHNINAGLQLKF